MRSQPFADLVGAGLLEDVERLVVAEHRAFVVHVLGEPWTPPTAYRWIRYENPDPVAALITAGERLESLWHDHRVGLQERVQLYGAAEEREISRLEAAAAPLGYQA